MNTIKYYIIKCNIILYYYNCNHIICKDIITICATIIFITVTATYYIIAILIITYLLHTYGRI